MMHPAEQSIPRRDLLRLLGGGLLLIAAKSAPSQGRPNVVLIVSDDHGYADVSCHQHPKEISTPNIDRIARRGVRFAQGYVSAYVCAPTRAALLTGRYQQRFGFYTASDSRVGLPLSELTMADILRKHGYATGAFGKWHLGLGGPYHPLKRGFDEFYGFLGHGAHDYFDLKRQPEDFRSIWRNDKVIDDAGYLTDNLGREAVDFIRKHQRRPFFLYLAFNAVHAPLQAPEETLRKFDTGRRNRDIYLAMLYHEDQAVGRVLDELEKTGLAENTIVVFLSDNGGARNNASNNSPLRDYKHSVYEGGIRVPFFMSWPARLPAGRVYQDPVICMDILPTVAAAVGAQLPSDRTYDGKNLLPYLLGELPGPVHEWLFWDGGEGKRAARNRQWKLVDNNGKIELFDLEADPGESKDLSVAHPEIVQRMRAALDEWCKKNAPRIGRGPELPDEEVAGRPTQKKKTRAK